jgi:hypothetical protein
LLVSVAIASTPKNKLDKYEVVANSGTIKTACNKPTTTSSWACTVKFTRNRICESGGGICTAGSEDVETEVQCSKKAPRSGWKVKVSGGGGGATGTVECESAPGETCDEGIYECKHSSLP